MKLSDIVMIITAITILGLPVYYLIFNTGLDIFGILIKIYVISFIIFVVLALKS